MCSNPSSAAWLVLPNLRLAALALVALLVVGCGGSDTRFAPIAPGAPVAPTTGDLTFQFIAPQAIQAPEGVSEVRFELLDGGHPVDIRVRDFATTITLSGVPATVDTVEITFITEVGIPLQVLRGPVVVTPGQSSTVNLTRFSASTPTLERILVLPHIATVNVGATESLNLIALFSNGYAVSLAGKSAPGLVYTADNSGFFTVANDGAITGVRVGTGGNLTVSLTANGTTLTSQVPVVVTGVVTGTFAIAPPTTTVNLGQRADSPLTANFTPTGGAATNVIEQVVFTSSDPNVGISASGFVSVGKNATPGSKVTLTGTYTQSPGNTFTDTVSVLVGADTLVSLSISPQTLSLPVGGARNTVTITGLSADGDSFPINFADYDFLTSDPSIAQFSNGIVTSGGAVGTATVTVRYKAAPNIIAQAQVTTVGGGGGGQPGSVVSITVTPTDNSLYISQRAPLQVTAMTDNGIAITGLQTSPNFALTTDSDYAILSNGNLVGLLATPTAQTLTFTYTDPAGNSFTDDVDIEVREVQIVSVVLRLAGIDPGQAGYAVLPRGVGALLEVIVTFEDGSTRPLGTFNDDYRVTANNNEVDISLNNYYHALLVPEPGATGTTTLTVVLPPAMSVNVPDPTLSVSFVAANLLALRAEFDNYPNDHRLIGEGNCSPIRNLDVRGDFQGAPNFRLSANEDFVLTTTLPIQSNYSLLGWPNLDAGSLTAPPSDVTLTYGARSATITGVSVIEPQSVDTAPLDRVPTVQRGDTITFRTLVDFGQGPEDRSLDYPTFTFSPLFSLTDFFWQTLGVSDGASTVFFKYDTATLGGTVDFDTTDWSAGVLTQVLNGVETADQLITEVTVLR